MTYLGCQINKYSNSSQEISKRIMICMTILKKLDIFWRHCDLTTASKITVLDAVIRPKLLYGIDSAQLTPSHQRRIEVFQLKGLRKILKMTTIYVERNNSNAEVFRKANEKIQLLDFERSPPIRALSGICGVICIWGGPLSRPGAPAVWGGGGGEGVWS